MNDSCGRVARVAPPLLTVAVLLIWSLLRTQRGCVAVRAAGAGGNRGSSRRTRRRARLRHARPHHAVRDAGGLRRLLRLRDIARHGTRQIPTLEAALKPLIVTLQVVPKVALVPLLILWFGFGPESKIVISAVLAFFPIFSNTLLGMKSVDRGRSSYSRCWDRAPCSAS